MQKLERIEDGVWVTNVRLDEYDVRGALVVGDRAAAVWDTLSRPADMSPFAALVGGRELAIVYSHADWDHIWGTAGLPFAGARIVAHAVARGRFAADVPAVLADQRAAQPGRWDDVVLVPPTEVFEGNFAIDLGGMTLALHHLPGHTADCIVGLIPERGVLLAGDTVETPCPVVQSRDALNGWVSELRRWAADDRVRLVVPAHGPMGGREILRWNVEYLEGLLYGRPIEPPGPLTVFYRQTHEQNLRVSSSGPGT